MFIPWSVPTGVGPASVMVGNLVAGKRIAQASGRDLGQIEENDLVRKVSICATFSRLPLSPFSTEEGWWLLFMLGNASSQNQLRIKSCGKEQKLMLGMTRVDMRLLAYGCNCFFSFPTKSKWCGKRLL